MRSGLEGLSRYDDKMLFFIVYLLRIRLVRFQYDIHVSVCFRYIDKAKGDLCRLYVFVISAAFQTLQKHLME